MARKAVYRQAALNPVGHALEDGDLTELLQSYEELCASVRLAGRWILGRARNPRDQRLLARFRETLRTADEVLGRTQPHRESEARTGVGESAGDPGKLLQFPAGKTRRLLRQS